MKILAIDPGLANPAACYSEDGLIRRAERIKVPKDWMKLEILERCARIAEAVVDWHCDVSQNQHGLAATPDVLIVEWPQWYGERSAETDKRIDPNDLAGLCGINGAIAGRIRTWPGGRAMRILSPKPREVWGNVPKSTKGNPWLSPRGMKLERRLKPGEREVIQSKHDALDAAGLAMFADGRWETRQLFPGAV